MSDGQGGILRGEASWKLSEVFTDADGPELEISGALGLEKSGIISEKLRRRQVVHRT